MPPEFQDGPRSRGGRGAMLAMVGALGLVLGSDIGGSPHRRAAKAPKRASAQERAKRKAVKNARKKNRRK